MLRQSWFLMKAQPSHPGYRPMRLKTRDYSLSGLYFVTICASQRRCVLGRIEKEQVELTALGHIARESWINLLLLNNRKSTRLNSSHANISYAVFCLTKKKPTLLVSSGP